MSRRLSPSCRGILVFSSAYYAAQACSAEDPRRCQAAAILLRTVATAALRRFGLPGPEAEAWAARLVSDLDRALLAGRGPDAAVSTVGAFIRTVERHLPAESELLTFARPGPLDWTKP